MALEDDIVAIDIMIRFTRNLKTKDDLLTAKEMLEHAAYFISASSDIIALHKKELAPTMGMVNRMLNLGKK